jgi:hypothetical protein
MYRLVEARPRELSEYDRERLIGLNCFENIAGESFRRIVEKRLAEVRTDNFS